MKPHAVFVLNADDANLPKMGLETGVYPFPSREAAINWMVTLLEECGELVFDGDLYQIDGEAFNMREEAILHYQDSLSATQYFHFYEIRDPATVAT